MMKRDRVFRHSGVQALRFNPQRLNARTPEHQRRRRQAGFTLVEMIVATLLLAIGVVAALIAISAATRATAAANDYTTVALLAQQRFTEIAAQPDQLTGGQQEGDFGADYPGFTWQQSVEPAGLAGLARVTLLVEWGSGFARRSASFVTYERQPEQQP